MKTNFSAATKRYLDIKAEEFGAQRQDQELGRVYYFIRPHW